MNKPMTAAQIKKLETILGKLENLQKEVASECSKDMLGNAKSELLDALRRG